MRNALVAGALTFVVGLGYGASMERYHLFPRQHLVAGLRALSAGLTGSGIEKSNTRTVRTHFANIEVTTWPIDDLAGAGAIAAAGSAVLGTDRRGNFFAYSREGNQRPRIEKLDVEIDTGYRRLAEHASGTGLPVLLNWFRVHDILLDEKSRRLFVSHHYWNEAGACSTLRVSLADVAGQELDSLSIGPDDWTVIHETAPCLELQPIGNPFEGLQAGARLALRGTDELLVTVGDHGLDGWAGTDDHPQLADSSYGKIWSISLADGSTRSLAIGLRTPQGLLIDDAGRIWVTDHGPRGGDELNLVREGGNYGWPFVTYGMQLTHYGNRYYEWPRSHAAEQGRHVGFDGAVYVWLNAIGVSNLIQSTGFLPSWDGDLLVASLKANALYRLRYEDGRVLLAEPLDVRRRIRDLDQLEDGRIVLWTDDSELIELRPLPVPEVLPPTIGTSDPAIRAEVVATIERCKQCHGTTAGSDSTRAPTLFGVQGRRIGDTGFEMYSTALEERAGSWDRQTLDEFLRDPQSFVRGTTMVYDGIAKEEVRNEVLDYLETLH